METTVIWDSELGEVSWKAVDQFYKNMSSQDAATRQQANQWLIKFYASDHSDKIATELLEFGDPANQLLGISLIDSKVAKDWDKQVGKIPLFAYIFHLPQPSLKLLSDSSIDLHMSGKGEYYKSLWEMGEFYSEVSSKINTINLTKIWRFNKFL